MLRVLIVLIVVSVPVLAMMSGQTEHAANAPVESWLKGKQAVLPKPTPPSSFTNAIGMEFCWIPPGSYTMGSNDYVETQPVHRVKFKKGFYLSKYEVTQAQWQRVAKSQFKYYKGDNFPVYFTSWYECRKFCEQMKKVDGCDYRLPTEAEWEYACRGGYQEITKDGPLRPRLFVGPLKEVGHIGPNPFGLYDMLGNAKEWCVDVFHPNYESAPADGFPRLYGATSFRVVRGVGRQNEKIKDSSIRRIGGEPHSDWAGFRVAFFYDSQ